jgi:type I site-specific restriction endonuclease
MDKRSLSERDICTKFITPALRQAGWDPRPLGAGFVIVDGASFKTG